MSTQKTRSVTVAADHRLLARKEAAFRLGISEVTLWRLVRDGRIGSYRIGSRLFFSEAHVAAYLDSVESRPNRSWS